MLFLAIKSFRPSNFNEIDIWLIPNWYLIYSKKTDRWIGIQLLFNSLLLSILERRLEHCYCWGRNRFSVQCFGFDWKWFDRKWWGRRRSWILLQRRRVSSVLACRQSNFTQFWYFRYCRTNLQVRRMDNNQIKTIRNSALFGGNM